MTSGRRLRSGPALLREFEITLRAFERGLPVTLIATPAEQVQHPPLEVGASEWLERAENRGFDQFPVFRGMKLIGVLLRERHPARFTVQDVMCKPGREFIALASCSLAQIIPMLRSQRFRLIVEGDRFVGLVTQSDLLKLPARMLLFGVITHLEACLREVVKREVAESEWRRLLSPKHRTELNSNLKRLRAAKLDPQPIELTHFSDLRGMLSLGRNLPADLAANMERIGRLRNGVAHGRTYISSRHNVVEFVDTYEAAERLIDWATRRLGA